MWESLMTLPQVTTLKSPAFRRISIRKMRTLGISLTDNADPLEAATRVNAQKAESKLRISALRCITVQESAATNSRCTRLSNLPLGGLPALPAQKRVQMGRGDDAHDARQSSSPALCFGWDGGPCHAGRRRTHQQQPNRRRHCRGEDDKRDALSYRRRHRVDSANQTTQQLP